MTGSLVSDSPPHTHAAGLGGGLRGLVQAAQSDTALRQSLATATSLSELVERAQAAGHPISVRELQLWANHALLEADFWPWASLTAEQKLLFFRKG